MLRIGSTVDGRPLRRTGGRARGVMMALMPGSIVDRVSDPAVRVAELVDGYARRVHPAVLEQHGGRSVCSPLGVWLLQADAWADEHTGGLIRRSRVGGPDPHRDRRPARRETIARRWSWLWAVRPRRPASCWSSRRRSIWSARCRTLMTSAEMVVVRAKREQRGSACRAEQAERALTSVAGRLRSVVSARATDPASAAVGCRCGADGLPGGRSS
jgi:hypothetical protein